MITSPVDQTKARQFERWFECTFWAGAIGCILLARLRGVQGHAEAILWLGIAVAVFTVVWYHLPPQRWVGLRKTFYGALVALIFISSLYVLTGGLRSPFGIGPVFILPVIASFLVLDPLRAWIVYGFTVIAWLVIGLHNFLTDAHSLERLWAPFVINVFGMTLATVCTAFLARQLHEQIFTERRLAKRLRESQAQLEDAMQQLHRLNSELQRMARVKDDFVAMVNHELRTPLTAMRQGIAMLLDGTLGPVTAEQREYVAVVMRNMDQLTHMVTNLLDLSRIQAGKIIVQPRPCPLDSLMAESLRLMQPLLERRTIRQEFPALPLVLADPARVLQVLNNLLSNAIKFTEADGVISLRAHTDGHTVSVNIADNGAGIPPEYLPRLFHRFERATTEASRAGTGLGLAICRELMELQQGRILVGSAPGGGTAVTLELPVAPQAAAVTVQAGAS